MAVVVADVTGLQAGQRREVQPALVGRLDLRERRPVFAETDEAIMVPDADGRLAQRPYPLRFLRPRTPQRQPVVAGEDGNRIPRVVVSAERDLDLQRLEVDDEGLAVPGDLAVCVGRQPGGQVDALVPAVDERAVLEIERAISVPAPDTVEAAVRTGRIGVPQLAARRAAAVARHGNAGELIERFGEELVGIVGVEHRMVEVAGPFVLDRAVLARPFQRHRLRHARRGIAHVMHLEAEQVVADVLFDVHRLRAGIAIVRTGQALPQLNAEAPRADRRHLPRIQPPAA